MTPTKPYLLRAIYDWSLDNELTPQVLVDASVEGVNVPSAYVKDGQILLNVHPQAVSDLALDNEHITFSARFGGNRWNVYFPISAALAIFTRENGRGIFFQPEHDETSDSLTPDPREKAGPRPVSEVQNPSASDGNSDDDGEGPGRGRPNLRLVD